MELLTKLEELILLSVWRLGKGAYGTAIYRHIQSATNKKISLGGVYFPLDRLAKNGFLRFYNATTTEERQGTVRRIYQLTETGLEALNDVSRVNEIMWDGYSEFALSSGEKRMTGRRSKPPVIGRRLLNVFLGKGRHNTLVGDFDELFAEMAASRGAAAARRWYWAQIARSFPSYIAHSTRGSAEMFRNYLTTSFRNIKKHRGYTLINVLGLAIGLAACLLVVLYACDEWSYDRYNVKADRITRVMALLVQQGKEMNLNGAGAPLAAALLEGFPEIEDAVRFREAESLRVKYGERQFRENRAVHADASFFNVFSIPILRGDSRTALAEPRTLVLSRTTAAKYFGQEDPVGKTLQITVDKPEDYTVTGVSKTSPGPPTSTSTSSSPWPRSRKAGRPSG